ncbi:tetratricopeptide repeat protein [Actinoplanes sp. NPDC024001]|uniref:tetratricopeptide repeat protein n=1 Tax=Actinoplanes sp. NPDC024001 TaxID=3154598 RepID=UPI0033C17257
MSFARRDPQVSAAGPGSAAIGRDNSGSLTINQFLASTPDVSWPLRVGVVPHRADSFQDRSGVPVPPAGTTLVLTGMGGVGKSQAAASLAERLLADGELDLLVWLAAGTRPAILTGYAQAARDLGIGQDSGVDADAARFHAWLATTGRRWLVVVDDLARPADLSHFWPPASGTGRTVVTTRLRVAALRGDGRTLLPVGVFQPEEAERYLTARLAEHPVLADDLAVAADLHLLPLALAQATAFMIDEQVPCSAYRARLAGRSARLDDLVPAPDDLPDDYDRTVASTLALSVEAADRSRPAGLARPLLELAAVLDPAGIPVELFTAPAVRAWLPGGAVAEAAVRSGLRTLHRLNLITESGGIVAIHGLVQRAVRERLDPDRLAEVALAAAGALTEIWPQTDPDQNLEVRLRLNVTALWRATGDTLVTQRCEVLFRAAASLGDIGLPSQAAAGFEEVLAAALRLLGPDHPDTLVARHEAARWHGVAGDPGRALAAFQRLLTDLLRVSGPEHPNTLSARHEIAVWRAESGDLKRALAELRSVLDDRIRLLGPDDATTLITRSNIARTLGRAGHPAAARAQFQELLTDMNRVFEPTDAAVLTTRHEIAFWLGHSGDTAGAAAEFARLHAELVRILPRDHPNIAACRAALAQWRGHAGDPAGAVTDLEAVLLDLDRTYGPAHPSTLIARASIAVFLGEAGDAKAAVAGLAALVPDLERVAGPDNARTLVTRFNLARWLGEAGDPGGAIAELDEVIAAMLRTLGPDHPDTLKARVVHAWWRARTGQAGPHALDRVIADLRRHLGPEHPTIALAVSYAEQLA